MSRWASDPENARVCPICRAELNIGAPFVKPKTYTINNVIASNLYTWVPKRMPVRFNFHQDLLYHLQKGNFTQAFKVCFLGDIAPNSQHEILAEGFLASYRTQFYENKCVKCHVHLPMEEAFSGRCGHFYCTMCAGFAMYGNRNVIGVNIVHCHECGVELTDPIPEFAFIRPMAITASPE